jgi:hypothetical protein
VYRGLDIVTNKISKAEQESCPHHLLGEIDSFRRFSVVDFRNRCLPLIGACTMIFIFSLLIEKCFRFVAVSEQDAHPCWRYSLLPGIRAMERSRGFNWGLIAWLVHPIFPCYKQAVYWQKPDSFALEIPDTVNGSGLDEEVLLEGFSRRSLLDPEVHHVETPSKVLHDLLKKLDAKAADELHPSDKRKIMRWGCSAYDI